MHKILISPQATIDLETIFDYTTAKWSFEQALKYQNELNNSFELIAQFPEIGVDYLFSKLDYKKYHSQRHLIFYNIDSNSITIMRILHENMDLKNIVK